MRTISALLAVFVLSGCVTTQEQATIDDDTCRSFGAKPGTDAYVQCRVAQQQQRTQIRAALIGAPADTCTKIGNTTSCY